MLISNLDIDFVVLALRDKDDSKGNPVICMGIGYDEPKETCHVLLIYCYVTVDKYRRVQVSTRRRHQKLPGVKTLEEARAMLEYQQSRMYLFPGYSQNVITNEKTIHRLFSEISDKLANNQLMFKQKGASHTMFWQDATSDVRSYWAKNGLFDVEYHIEHSSSLCKAVVSISSDMSRDVDVSFKSLGDIAFLSRDDQTIPLLVDGDEVVIVENPQGVTVANIVEGFARNGMHGNGEMIRKPFSKELWDVVAQKLEEKGYFKKAIAKIFQDVGIWTFLPRETREAPLSS